MLCNGIAERNGICESAMRKTVLVTGATSGIGQETARQLAARGAQVIVAGRDQRKAEATVAAIRRETGNDHVDFLLADFASLAAIRGLSQQVKAHYGRLDVLVNNAGATFFRRELSEDGYEMTFAVNHLAPFLLTNLLLDTLDASAPARIVNVASDAHAAATMDLEDLQYEQGYGIMKAYSRSKLANIMFTYELARRLQGSQITVNAVHPGFVSTGMGTNNVPRWLGRIFQSITGLFARDAAQGAETVIYLADAADVEGISGLYYQDMTPIQSSALSYDEALARRLWESSAAMVDLPAAR